MGLLDGNSPEVEAVDQGDGFGVFGNSNTKGTTKGLGVIGVRGGFAANPSPVPFAGVVGLLSDQGAGGALGTQDPIFGQLAGVYGQSSQQGVIGLSTGDAGTGVYGGNTSGTASQGIGVRGETMHGVGVQGRSFGSGLAGRFIGDVEITGALSAAGTDLGELSSLRASVAQLETNFQNAQGALQNALNVVQALEKRVKALGG